MDYNNNLFSTVSEKELVEVNGGGPVIVIAIICIIALGVYNGYKDTKDQK